MSHDEIINEDGAPTNSIGTSTGVGALDTFDPIMTKKTLKRKKLKGFKEFIENGRTSSIITN